MAEVNLTEKKTLFGAVSDIANAIRTVLYVANLGGATESDSEKSLALIRQQANDNTRVLDNRIRES